MGIPITRTKYVPSSDARPRNTAITRWPASRLKKSRKLSETMRTSWESTSMKAISPSRISTAGDFRPHGFGDGRPDGIQLLKYLTGPL